MWTRSRLQPGTASLIAPWNVPVRHCTQTRAEGPSGRMAGSFPGYGARLSMGRPVVLEDGLYRGGQLYPGFGIAMDPSDPSTWTRPVSFSPPWQSAASRSTAVGKAWNKAGRKRR